MKQSIKILFLGLLAMGTLSGCDFSLPSNSSSNGSSGSSVSESGSSSSSGSSSKSSESSSQGESSSSGESSSEDYSSEDSSESESQSEESSGSEESSSSSSSEDVPPGPKTDWTDEEKILMRDYLHGIVLPFLEVEGAALDFDEGLEKFSIEQLAIEDGDIATYAAKFTAADGWNDVSNQYSVYSTAPAGSFYVFERFVATDEGRRGISVQFFGHDGTSYSTAGPMYLYASDPFAYEFPDLEEEYGYYEVENGTPVIAPESSDLYFEFVPDSYNDLYYEYDYPEYLNANIYIYGLDLEAFEDYLGLYEENDWVVTPDESYENAYIATLLDEDVNLEYEIEFYFTTDYVVLSFKYLGEEPAGNWPADAISAAFESVGAEEFYVLPLEGEGYEYEPYDNSEYGYFAIYITNCTPEDLADYAEALYDEGWDYVEVDGEYTATMELEDGIAKLEFYYDDYWEQGYLRIYLFLDSLPSAEWPVEDIKDMIGEDVASELPAFEVEGYEDATFKVYDQFGLGITVFTGGDEDTASAAMGEYAQILLDADFEYDEETKLFTAPSELFFVELYVGTDGAFNIEISFPKTISALDLEVLADMFDEIGWDLEIPAFEIESETGFDYISADPTDPDDYFMIYAFVSSSSIANQAIEDYEAILLENDFTSDGENNYGEPLLLDPTGVYQLELTYNYYNGSCYFAINIRDTSIEPKEPEATPLDADKVAEMFEASEWEGFAFPEFEMFDAEIYYWEADPTYPYCQIACYFDVIDGAEEAFDNLVAELNASEDFEYVGPLDSGATGDAEFTTAGYDIQIMYGYTQSGPAMFINIYLAE